jgi:hypothetical protein
VFAHLKSKPCCTLALKMRMSSENFPFVVLQSFKLWRQDGKIRSFRLWRQDRNFDLGHCGLLASILRVWALRPAHFVFFFQNIKDLACTCGWSTSTIDIKYITHLMYVYTFKFRSFGLWLQDSFVAAVTMPLWRIRCDSCAAMALCCTL